MKRIPITRSLWHPPSRTMASLEMSGLEVNRIVLGIKAVAYCCRGTLTLIGVGGYKIGRRDA